MLFFSFLSWWYTEGWIQQFKNIIRALSRIARSFSIGTLIKTLFAPWRQIVSNTGEQMSLNQRFHALIDNSISRFIGFWVRLFTLLAAFIILGAALVFRTIAVLLWPLLPPGAIVLLFLGVTGLGVNV